MNFLNKTIYMVITGHKHFSELIEFIVESYNWVIQEIMIITVIITMIAIIRKTMRRKLSIATDVLFASTQQAETVFLGNDFSVNNRRNLSTISSVAGRSRAQLKGPLSIYYSQPWASIPLFDWQIEILEVNSCIWLPAEVAGVAIQAICMQIYANCLPRKRQRIRSIVFVHISDHIKGTNGCPEEASAVHSARVASKACFLWLLHDFEIQFKLGSQKVKKIWIKGLISTSSLARQRSMPAERGFGMYVAC